MSVSPPLGIHAKATHLYLEQMRDFYTKNQAGMFPPSGKQPYKSLQKTLDKINNVDLDSVNTKKLYTRLQNDLDRVAKYEIRKQRQDPNFKSGLDTLYLQVFENDNKMHDTIYSEIISKTNNYEAVLNSVANHTTNPGKKYNIRHPDNPLNAFFSAMLGVRYNPLKKNNVPYIAFNNQQSGSDRTCLRFGAQTQGTGTVNPTFERYLLANSRRSDTRKSAVNNNDFQYVYINLLKREQSAQDVATTGMAKRVDKFVRFSEGKRASALEGLNEQKDLKAAVITLPADGDFFLGKFNMEKGDVIVEDAENINNLFVKVVTSIRDNRNDFYMSDAVKTKLFGNNFKSDIQNNQKLITSFQDATQSILGDNFDSRDNITQAQRSAILFQFVKFNLTQLILDKLDPPVYNISCKDAIDRGGIHTLYYHMNVLHEKSTPMSKADFLKNLDAPALIVKYRPLNHNRNLIWNALNQRMKNDRVFNKNHEWVNDWLKNNTPSAVAAKVEASTPERVDGLDKGFSNNPVIDVSLSQHRVAPVTRKQQVFIASHRAQKRKREDNQDNDKKPVLGAHREKPSAKGQKTKNN